MEGWPGTCSLATGTIARNEALRHRRRPLVQPLRLLALLAAIALAYAAVQVLPAWLQRSGALPGRPTPGASDTPAAGASPGARGPSARPTVDPAAATALPADPGGLAPWSPLSTPPSRPSPSGYQLVPDIAAWNNYEHRRVAIAGTFGQEIGPLGQYYSFVFNADPPEGRQTRPVLLVTYDGLPDPSWRPGAPMIVYGEAQGYADMLGTQMPLVRAEGISRR